MKQVFDVYRMMLAESALVHEKEGKTALATALKQAQRQLYRLLQMRGSRKAVSAFVGTVDAGKSTLLSALFAPEITQSGNRAWSSVPVEYSYGEKFEVSAEHANAIGNVSSTHASADAMLAHIASYAKAGKKSETPALFAQMPSGILRDGLIIADTPDYAAGQAPTVRSYGETLLNCLSRADYVFWIINSRRGITGDELRFCNQYLSDKCDGIIVNCIDTCTDEEKKKFIKENEELLRPGMSWHFVNAKRALSGKMNHDFVKIAESGILDFEQFMHGLGVTASRLDFLEKSLVGFFYNLAQYKNRCQENRFFVEHRRMALEHMLKAYPSNLPLTRAMAITVSATR